MSKKIVFVNQATGYLTIDVINEFAKVYDEIAVITDSIRVQDIPLHDSVKVSKIIGRTRKTNLQRGIKWAIATVQIYFLLITKYRDYEVFYYTVPPFSYFCSLLLRRKFSVMIFDVYPDILKNYNISENHYIYRLWSCVNRKVFAKSHRIYTIGDGLADIIEKYVNREKISVVYLWTGLTNAKPIDKGKNIFAEQHDLVSKFVVQYSGNIGQTHNVESLVEVAREMREYEEIQFLIIGRGTRFEYIKNLVSDYNLDNCEILPFQPDDMIQYSLAAADVGTVVIDENAAQMSIPSKVYNIMAVGSALLCIAPPKSELFDLVQKYQNGEAYSNSDIDGIKNYILKLYSNDKLLNKYKNNSISASQNYKRDNASKILSDYMGEVTKT